MKFQSKIYREMIKYTLQKDGFVGELHIGTKYPEKVIIRPGGIGKPLKYFSEASRFLGDTGCSVIIIGLYLWDGMSREAAFIPIDYVEKAIEAAKRDLEKESGCKEFKFSICGFSLGASYSLAAASLIPEISAVVAASPYDYVIEATKKNKPLSKSSFSYHGKELPFLELEILRYDLLRLYLNIERDENYGRKRAFRYILDHTEKDENAIIKTENMKADVLLIAPSFDDFWPSEKAVERIEKRLSENNYEFSVKTVIIEGGSHILGLDIDLNDRKLKSTLTALKENPTRCSEALMESVGIINSFYENEF